MCSTEVETASIEIPDYDLRRLCANRDPLCAVYAFQVMVRVVFAGLYGLRMCPLCPHCDKSLCPCMDKFGSNATPLGGSAGRGDAMIGAVESQKVGGCIARASILVRANGYAVQDPGRDCSTLSKRTAHYERLEAVYKSHSPSCIFRLGKLCLTAICHRKSVASIFVHH